MKVQVTQENLTKALNAAQRVTTSRTGLDILNNILIKTEGNRLLIASTNLEMASTHLIGAKIIKEGSITVPAKLISEFVSSLPKDKIDINVENDKIMIQSGGYKSTINGMKSDDFPDLPTIDDSQSIHYVLDTKTFKQTVSQTIFASSKDSTRPVLTGVYWHTKDNRLLVASTDGYRLAEKDMIETKSELSAIVPATTLQEAVRLLDDDTESVDVLFDDSQVRFRFNDTELTSKLIDGKYPDYAKLIPSEYKVRATTSNDEFMRVTKIASLFSRNSGNSIIIKIDEESQKISVQSVTSEVGENSSDIDSKVEGTDQISLNSRYLIEALSAIDSDSINIEFNGKLNPCVITPDEKKSDYKHIIMPLKS